MRKTKEVTAADYVRYAATRSPRLRCRLLEANLPLVHAVAASVSRSGVPLEIGDLEAWGTIGLCRALDRYDPAKGVLFATFAGYLIRGAIIDGIREMDPAPRLMRRRQKFVEAVKARAGRELSPAELSRRVASELARATPEARQSLGTPALVLADSSPPSVLSLSCAANPDLVRGEEGMEAIETTAGVEAKSAARDPDRWELWGHLTLGLLRPERLLLILYYLEGLTMKETALAIGVSESRVSQLHKALLPRLRDRLVRTGLLSDFTAAAA